MLQLAVRHQTTDAWVMLDVSDIGMEIMFAIADIANITKRTSPHSLSFNLPMSPTNNGFFGLDADIDASLTQFDWTQETEGEILDSSIPVLEGTLQVLSVDMNLRTYECVFYGQNSDVYLKWDGRTWRDIFTDTNDQVTQSLNFVLTPTNIKLSWTGDITQGLVGNGILIIPLLDRGLTNTDFEQYSGWYGAGGSYNTGIFNPAATQQLPEELDGFIMSQTQRPAIQIPYLIDQLANYAGYTVKAGGFFDNYAADKLYMTLGTDKELLGQNFGGFYTLLTGTYTNLFSASIGVAWHADLFFADDTCADCYDPEGLMSAGQYSPPTGGYFNFGISITINSSGTPTALETQFYLEWFVDGVLVNSTPYQYIVGGGVQSFGEYSYLSNSLTINTGQVASIRMSGYQTSSHPLSIVNSGTHLTLQDTGIWALTNINTIAMFPDESVDKWIKALFAQFNLVMLVDVSAKTLDIKTHDDYMAEGLAPLDWTDRLDMAKGFRVTPMTDYLAREITFKDKQGKDISNNWWDINIDKVIGQLNYDMSTSPFLIDDKTVGDYFIPYRQAFIPTAFNSSYVPVDSDPWSNIRVMRMWESIGTSGVKDGGNTTMLFFFHGATPTLNYAGQTISYLLRGSAWWGGDTISTNRHPITSVKSNTSTDLDVGYMLTWRGRILHDDEQGKTRGLYEQFYGSMIAERYHQDAKVAECTMLLSPDDVSNLKYNQKIFINGTYWYVEKVSNYQVGKNEPCRVQLRKFLGEAITLGDTTRDCNLTPVVQHSGQVLFTDGAITSAGSIVCCEQNDYYWDNIGETCWWNWNGGNDGGVGDHGEPNDHGANAIVQSAWVTPLMTGDANRIIERQYLTELPVEMQVFEMNASTASATTTNAKTLGGVDSLTLLPDTQYNLELFITTRSARTSGTTSPLLDNVKYAQSLYTVGMATQTSTTGAEVFKDTNGTGLSSSIAAATGLDGVPKLQIRCTDAYTTTGTKDWTIRVEATISPTQARTSATPPETMNVLFQDGVFVIFQNGDGMVWN